MRPTLLAMTPLLAALIWALALVLQNEPFEAGPALLIGVGLLATATVAGVGMVVVGGRWAHRLGCISLGMTVIVAMVRDIDSVWIIGTVATAAAFVAILSPALTSTIRNLPSAAGPPPRAVTPPLILLATPAILGFVGNGATTWALLVVGLTAPNAAFLYSRVLPGGLLAIRLVWPLTTLALAPLLGWAGGLAAAVLALAVGTVAWDRSVKASYHPPRATGTTVPIPPELAPGAVLDAAEVDEKGHRR